MVCALDTKSDCAAMSKIAPTCIHVQNLMIVYKFSISATNVSAESILIIVTSILEKSESGRTWNNKISVALATELCRAKGKLFLL